MRAVRLHLFPVAQSVLIVEQHIAVPVHEAELVAVDPLEPIADELAAHGIAGAQDAVHAVLRLDRSRCVQRQAVVRAVQVLRFIGEAPFPVLQVAQLMLPVGQEAEILGFVVQIHGGVVLVMNEVLGNFHRLLLRDFVPLRQHVCLVRALIQPAGLHQLLVPMLHLDGPGSGVEAVLRFHKTAHQLFLAVAAFAQVVQPVHVHVAEGQVVFLSDFQDFGNLFFRKVLAGIFHCLGGHDLLHEILAAQQHGGQGAGGQQRENHGQHKAHRDSLFHRFPFLSRFGGHSEQHVPHVLFKIGRDGGQHGVERFFVDLDNTLHSNITSRSRVFLSSARAR